MLPDVPQYRADLCPETLLAVLALSLSPASLKKLLGFAFYILIHNPKGIPFKDRISSRPGQPQSHYVAEDNPKLFIFLPLLSRCTNRHIWFIQCSELNPGLCMCWVSTRPAELHRPLYKSFVFGVGVDFFFFFFRVECYGLI